MKRLICILLTLIMAIGLLAGCGDSKTNSDSGNGDVQAKDGNAKNEKRVKMVIHLDGVGEDIKLQKAMDEVKKMDKYSNVDFEVHGREADYLTAVQIAIAAGEQKDIIIVPNPMYQQQWADAGSIVPLDDLAKKIGIDFDNEFGKYVENASNDGSVYIVPQNITTWALYYNKKIFDDAGVPYPDDNIPMTWDEYREVASKLTSGEGSDKNYGAFYLNWGTFWYGDAIMALNGGEHFYNEEKLSNIEDPVFARSMKRTHDMMHVDKSMPTHANVKTSQTGCQAFLNGQYGMDIQGGWVLPWIADKENFPRDWEIGVAPLPVDSGKELKTWGIVNGFGIARSSKDPELAFQIAMDLSRLSAKYAQSSPSANQSVPQDMLFTALEEPLKDDNISVDQLLHLFANPNIKYVTEKITGPNNVQYERVINEEVEKYFVNEQDLDTTIANIKERGDKVILDK